MISILTKLRKKFNQILLSNHELNYFIENERISQIVRILDCTYYHDRNAIDDFNKERIPGSIFFNIDEISDKESNLPNMIIKDEKEFIKHMKRLDIRKDDIIVCYDRKGIFSSPRVWFNFKIFGAKDVFVLDGGFPFWISKKLPIEKNNEKKIFTRPLDENIDEYNYTLDKYKLLNLDNILKIANEGGQIIDARSKERYDGIENEPRITKRLGHIPGAINIPYDVFINDNNCFKEEIKIRRIFESKGIDFSRDLNFYSGSGITACINIFALELIKKNTKTRLYNGSWAEYGNIDIEENELIKELEKKKI